MIPTHTCELATFGRRLIVILACTALASCYSFQPIAGTPEELRGQLRSGDLVKVGDYLKVQTTDGHDVRIHVVAIDQHSLRSSVRTRSKEVLIDDVEALQRGHFSTGKTVLLVGGIALVLVGADAAATAAPLPAPAVSF